MIFGTPRWPSRWAWKAGTGTAVLSILLLLLGTMGRIVLAVVILAIVAIAANRRPNSVDPDEEFRNSRPPE